MRNRPSPNQPEHVSKPKRFKTTLYLPDELWKRTKIAAIETDKDATDIVIEALEQYLRKGGRG